MYFDDVHRFLNVIINESFDPRNVKKLVLCQVNADKLLDDLFRKFLEQLKNFINLKHLYMDLTSCKRVPAI